MTQTSAVDLLQEWCAGLARGDVEGCLGLLADDVVVHAPFVPELIPRLMEGRDVFADAFRFVGGLFALFRWTALDLHAGADEGCAFGIGSSEITLVDGRPYTQDYAFMVGAAGGRIVEYHEYMDPIRAQAALSGFAPVP